MCLSACSSLSEPWCRRGGGITRGNVTPTSQRRANQSINNVGLKKLHSNLSAADCERVHTGGGAKFNGRFHRPARDVTVGRRKTLSPNVPPLAIDVTTCRQRTAMFCWLCRHGEEEKVGDTMFLLSAFSHHGHNASK